MGSWPLVPLGELTENLDSRRVPVKESDRRPGPYPYYGASGIVDHVSEYLFEGEHLLIAEDGENLRTRNTPIAFLANGRFWVNNHAHIVRGSERAITRYLCYALAQTDVSGYLTGSTLPKLTQGSLNRIPIPAPSLPEQRAIAAVLGSLDDKIDLNRRMNATLEATARAIFKAWFVDFEALPVEAGRREPVAMVAERAARYGPAERGRDATIPAGWRVTSLAEIFDLNPPRPPGDTKSGPYVDMATLPTRGHAIEAWRDREWGSGARFRNGDTLVARITPCLENGKAAFVDCLRDEEVGWGSTEYIVMRPRPPIPAYFAYLLTREPDFRAYAVQNMSGSSGRQRVAADVIGRFTMALPSSGAIWRKLGTLLEPIVAAIRSHTDEILTLAALRDTLLPKLLSGEVRVKDIA